MTKATTIVRKAAVKPDQVADWVTLDHTARMAAYGHVVTSTGTEVRLQLAKAAILEDGDALRLEDGRLVAVRAQEEALLEVRAENPARLLRLAWQLGGSHVPVEVGADALYAPASAAELVRGAGCSATPVTRAFKPEKDAHDHSRCGHDHGHDHSHNHGHSHDHDHAHDPAHGHSHGHEH